MNRVSPKIAPYCLEKVCHIAVKGTDALLEGGDRAVRASSQGGSMRSIRQTRTEQRKLRGSTEGPL